jgi:hypothetical protein
MFAQLSHSSAPRLLAALVVALTLGLALGLTGGAATPANADASQWTRSQSNWGNSTGWNRHWRSQTHQRNQFNNGTQVIIGGGSGIIVTSPGFVTGNSGFIVRQPGFIVGQPAFVVRQPNFIFERPSFAKKQWEFIKRHPSLHANQPWWHNNWSHRRWKHKRHQMSGGMGGMN